MDEEKKYTSSKIVHDFGKDGAQCQWAKKRRPRPSVEVIVAMSGGVDSSVTARLLADQDYDLSAIFMRNWDTRDESGSDTGCEWEKDWEDVQLVCRQLGLPCELVDLSREYWTSVFEPSLRMWESGRTPNPDVWCNREVKFGALINHVASKNGARWLATGHYAGVEWTTTPFSLNSERQYEKIRARPKLIRALDRTKDQTYYLSSMKESSLEKAIFPLQHLRKAEVRELAARYKLPTAKRNESMGICFVGQKRRFEDFLAEYIPERPGPIVDLITRRRVGTHKGLWHYTIGQSARIPGLPEKMFVARKNAAQNKIFVVPGSTHPALYSSCMVVEQFQWMWTDEVPSALDSLEGFRARVQFRHRMSDVSCTVRNQPLDRLIVEFSDPQLAVAAGQIAALYDEEGRWCLGSGEIIESIHL